jgi:hypothetical protein
MRETLTRSHQELWLTDSKSPNYIEDRLLSASEAGVSSTPAIPQDAQSAQVEKPG